MTKKLAIMQPYLFPYIGYFQLINSVDEFVIYDNIQYTKKGWINRNRILVNNKEQILTLPLQKDSDYLDIIDRKISNSWIEDRKKLINVFKSSYNKAPYFSEIFGLIQECLCYDEKNLFKFILNSLNKINKYLEINTPIIVSSTINIDYSLKSQDKVLAICESQKATTYINSIGGTELYDKNIFKEKNIILNFIKSEKIEYKQFTNEFIPWLSIIDIMMFNSKDKIQEYLNSYTLI
jgi:hypothetical protein